MNGQDRFAVVGVGQIQNNAPVKSAGTQQRRIKMLRPVGGAQNDDSFAALNAVHFRQNLV
jgi:hypothetical protein